MPELQRLARRCSPDPETALIEVLGLLCEQLDMDIAVVGRFVGEVHEVDIAVRRGAGRDRDYEGARAAGQTWCRHVPMDAPLVVRDVADAPHLAVLENTRIFRVSCYVGRTLQDEDGAPTGVLGVIGHAPHERLDERDLAVLDGLAEVVAPLHVALLAAERTTPTPTPPAADEHRLAAQDLEVLTRPLLDALHQLSSLASTMLTVLRDSGSRQEILLAHNSREGFALPEGAALPWEQSPCRRALADGTPAVVGAAQRWPEVAVAAALGLDTYLSVPVHLSDGSFWGTLCAADPEGHAGAAAHLPTLTMFARLIAAEVERSSAVADARALALAAQQQADTDELTGCSARRTVRPWLVEALATVQEHEVVVLAFIDIDRFKDVNDRYGHATGDALLAALGARLRQACRPHDLVGRLGGDEFVVGTRLPRSALAGHQSRIREAGDLLLSTPEGALLVRCSTGFATSDTSSDPASLLDVSDAQMYADKIQHRG